MNFLCRSGSKWTNLAVTVLHRVNVTDWSVGTVRKFFFVFFDKISIEI